MPKSDAASGAAYAGVARSPRTLRIYDPLYARVGALVRALEDEGYGTDRTELIHAVLHFELPADAAGTRKLLRRWRRYLAELERSVTFRRHGYGLQWTMTPYRIARIAPGGSPRDGTRISGRLQLQGEPPETLMRS